MHTTYEHSNTNKYLLMADPEDDSSLGDFSDEIDDEISGDTEDEDESDEDSSS